MADFDTKHDLLGLKYSEKFAISGIEEANVNLELVTVVVHSCTIIGKVTDEHGHVANVTVKLFDGNGKPYRHTLTDDDGEYAFDELPAGTYGVAAAKHGYVTSKTQSVTLSDGSTLQVSITLVEDETIKYGTIAGLIRDVNNKHLDGVNVTLLDAEEKAAAVTYTVDDGEFTFYDIEPATYTVVASANGYLPSGPMTVIVNANGIVNMYITLEVDSRVHKGTVNGVIRDSSDHVVANAFVGLYLVTVIGGVVSEQLVAVCRTNSVGAYLFGEVSAGEYVVKAKMNRA